MSQQRNSIIIPHCYDSAHTETPHALMPLTGPHVGHGHRHVTSAALHHLRRITNHLDLAHEANRTFTCTAHDTLSTHFLRLTLCTFTV